MTTDVPRLVTIPFSHYCEKARWSLDRCGVAYTEDGHLPMLHWLASFRAGGGRTVPVLATTDGVLRDSTDIAAWADRHRPGALITAAALPLEDDFDRVLGPATRRWGYSHLLERTDLADRAAGTVAPWEVRTMRVARPLIVRLMRRGLRIYPDAVARASVRIDETFARVAERLADGRPFLCGDHFTIADLTFAALSMPVLRPPEFRFGFPHDVPFAPGATAAIDRWRATPAGAFALGLYATERYPRL